jgi:hypothetical protein
MFLSEEERHQMITETTFICFFQQECIRFDRKDNCFWSFGRLEKQKVSIQKVRRMPEVKLFKIKLSDYQK